MSHSASASERSDLALDPILVPGHLGVDELVTGPRPASEETSTR